MNSKPLSIILLAASVAGIAWASTAVGDGSMLPAIVAAVSMLAGIIDVVLFAASSGSAVAGVLAAVISIALAASAAGVTTLAMVGEEAGETAPVETTVETTEETVKVTPSTPDAEPMKPQQETEPSVTAPGTVPGAVPSTSPEAVVTVPSAPVVYVREQTLVPDGEEAEAAAEEALAEEFEEAPVEEVIEEALGEEAAVEEILEEEAPTEEAVAVVPSAPAVPSSPSLAVSSKVLAGVPEEPQITSAEAELEPVVITESVLGYMLTVTAYPGKVILEYPSIVTEEDAAGFFAYEVDKYGEAYLAGIYYTSEKGSSTLRVPETVSEETIVSAVPVLVDDIIEYVSLLLAPAVPEEPQVTAVEAEEVEEAYEPIVITESVLGYTLTVTVYPGKVVLGYPSIVTEEDAAGFFAYEIDKYGEAYLAGIYYTSEKGASTLRVPETVSDETIVSAVPVLVDDIIEYVSLLLAPAVSEEPQVTAVEAYEPIVITESVLGYTLTVTVYEEKVVLEYPSIVTEEDAAGFFAYEVDKYGEAYLAGIYYTSEKGASALTVPETVSEETIVSAVPVLVDDIIEYVSLLLAPAEEAVIVPVVEAEVPEIPEVDVRSIMLIEEPVPDAPEVDVRSIMLSEEEIPETPDVDVRSIELLEAEVPDAPEIYYTIYLED